MSATAPPSTKALVGGKMLLEVSTSLEGFATKLKTENRNTGVITKAQKYRAEVSINISIHEYRVISKESS